MDEVGVDEGGDILGAETGDVEGGFAGVVFDGAL